MAEQWQIRRGTNTQNNSFTGAQGELTMDTDRKELRLHDSSTPGGIIIGRNYKTNCITEIPQNIKLELNNGTLTLKAGSKIYVPNGVGVFDEVVIENDIVASTGTSVTSCFLFYNNSNSLLNIVAESSCYSGDTEPTTTPYVWYNIANNIITRNTGSSTFNYSLPLAKITCNSSSQIVSIDQVFNGFGYIGSTLFALPGVKGLIPNGRNTDGTLKNIEFSISSVLIRTFTTQNVSYGMLGINPSFSNYFGLTENASYDEQSNRVLENGVEWAFCIIGCASVSSGTITYFNIKSPFHAVDYSEADFVVSFQRPTAANNYTWYRKYKSGWVEQGGQGVAGSGITYVTLPVQMANIAYTVTGAVSYSGTQEGTVGFQFIKQTSSLGIGGRYNGIFNNGLAVDWQVSGMAA